MRKLQLNVESITLESFDIPQADREKGTVNANLDTSPCQCTICKTCPFTCVADCTSIC